MHKMSLLYNYTVYIYIYFNRTMAVVHCMLQFEASYKSFMHLLFFKMIFKSVLFG